ncbi:hypothetical protein Bbelb_342700 [Branchiostoma belcheri]|nr:hypothetical protein Bbelb_342700 [Branchiostoma belcheri]
MYMQNQNNGVYRNGIAYGNEKRLTVLRCYIRNNGCIASTARDNFCSDSYVRAVVSRFVQTGELEHRQGHGNGGQRVPEHVRIYLETLVTVNPTLYIRELLRQLLQDDLALPDQDTPCEASICRWLAEDRLTLKVAARTDGEIHPDGIWVERQKGMFYHRNYMAPFMRRGTYLVMDNASIHNEADLRAIFAPLGITVVKLPPYSYDFNPIELVFGLVKSRLRRQPNAVADNPALTIMDGFLSVSAATVRNFYRRCWRAGEGP